MMISKLEPERPSPLSAEERLGLLRLARRALLEYLGQSVQIQPGDGPAVWSRPRAVFVTLRRGDSGALRGCRGETRARRPLAEAVVTQAIASAVHDQRFQAVTFDELSEIQIQLSVLTTPAPIQPDQVVPGQHGLLLIRGECSGLLLPQVATYHGFDRDAFLDALCRKAGLGAEALTATDAQLFGFEAEVWGEERSSSPPPRIS